MTLRPRRVHLIPPVSYQGGKRRQAPEIVRHMALDPETPFYDLCCGSGAVSLELISRGHNPAKITMVDAGPWGDVWRLVGAGEFGVSALEQVAQPLLRARKHDPAIPNLLARLAEDYPPSHRLAPYAFLLMQSGAFGCKAISVFSERWRIPGWSTPGDRQHPPLIPEPDVLLGRMDIICRYGKGITGIKACATSLLPQAGAVVYVDPDYKGSTSYGHSLNPAEVTSLWAENAVYVSEQIPLSSSARLIRSRKRGGITGLSTNKVATTEYLSLFNADWPTPDVDRVQQMSLFEGF